MTQQQTTLPNGVRIITTEMPDARTVTASIWVKAGSRYEDAKVNGGVSHFLEHLLFKGSHKYPNWEAIATAVDGVGGYNNAFTTEEFTNYYIKVPARHRDLPLNILADMVSAPLFDPEDIDRERGVIIEEMNVYRDNPARFIDHALTPQLMFPGNALSEDVIGTEEVIHTITPAAIRAYWRSRYQPHNFVVSVAGRTKHERVVAQVKELLGDLKDHAAEAFVPVGSGVAKELVLAYSKDTAQAHFVIAGRSYPAGDRQEAVANVLSTILGRGSSSRLFTNVRERRGLAYTVYSNVSTYIDTGMITMYAGVNLEKVDEALEAILEECGRIREELVGTDELNKAKELCAGAFDMYFEGSDTVAEQSGGDLIQLGKVKTIEQQIAAIQRVTARQVREAAREILDPAGLRLAIIAPDPSDSARRFEQLVTGER